MGCPARRGDNKPRRSGACVGAESVIACGARNRNRQGRCQAARASSARGRPFVRVQSRPGHYRCLDCYHPSAPGSRSQNAQPRLACDRTCSLPGRAHRTADHALELFLERQTRATRGPSVAQLLAQCALRAASSGPASGSIGFVRKPQEFSATTITDDMINPPKSSAPSCTWIPGTR